jgi:hypothetical protein
METRRGGETVIKGGGAKGMLKSQLPMQQPSAMTPQAEATTPPMAEAAGKAEDAGKRMAAGDGSQYIKEKIKGIQEQTQKEIEALQRQKAREIESEEILAGYHPLAGYPPEEEEEGTPPQIPYRIFPPATSEKPEKPTPTSETPAEEQGQLPSWYAKARRLGVDDNNLLKELSERGEGPANKFVDEVENALGGGYTGQSANELLRNTMRGEHLEKRKEGEE